ncbi:L-gulonolactone oxidase-like [Mytilus edulis]|uniref:L-gulonolactone oxidase-like n=1 Tax=Mytilus edulis TaxID=6550 RepID=UPI0039F11D66
MGNNNEKPEIVDHEKPDDCEQLKKCFKKAMDEKKMVILALGDRDKDWIKDARCNEKIVMVDCKSLYDEQMKRSTSQPVCPDLSEQTQCAEDEIDKTLASLKTRIGDTPTVQKERFVNWGKTQSMEVISSSPTTKEELQKLVLAASEEGLSVRCAGRGHSWAPLFSDSNQLLIHVEDMKSDYKDGSKIRISDREKREVDIMTGATTEEFKNFQLEHKVNIPGNVVLDCVHMVSVVATGCHGVGKDVQTPGDDLVRMRVIGSDGKLRTYTSDDKEMLKAISSNLGCFGVIFDMTIKVVPEVIVKVENRYEPLKELFSKPDSLQNIFEENWSVQILWFPYNSLGLFDYDPKDDELWIRVINKKPKDTMKVKTETQTYYDWKETKDCLTAEGLSIVSSVVVENPSLTPWFAWAAFGSLKHIVFPKGPMYQELPHAVHFRQHTDKAPVNCMEFAFDFNPQRLQKIIQVVVEKVDHHEDKDEYPLNLVMEMRLMGYSDSFLSPAIIGNPAYGGSGCTFTIEVLSIVDTKGWRKFATDVGKEWMALDGVPHLAKQWDFLPGIEDHIYKHMGQHIDAFKEQLQKSGADPNGMFLNKSIRKLLRL